MPTLTERTSDRNEVRGKLPSFPFAAMTALQNYGDCRGPSPKSHLTDHTVYRKLRLFPVLGAISGEFFSVSYKISGSFNGKCTRFHSRKRNNPNQLDPIIEISTKKGFSVRHVRNMFSHEFTFDKKEGKVVIKLKEKGKQRSKILRIGPVEWLYMSDMMRLMLYPLYMSAMVHSPK